MTDWGRVLQEMGALYQGGGEPVPVTGGPAPRAAPKGEIQPGNIDLAARPRVVTPDGRIATVRSMGVNVDGNEVVIPTVSDDGRLLSPQEAFQAFMRSGRHLGIFDTQKNANAYGKALHEQQAKDYR